MREFGDDTITWAKHRIANHCGVEPKMVTVILRSDAYARRASYYAGASMKMAVSVSRGMRPASKAATLRALVAAVEAEVR
jgi:hypothetical protein